MKKKKQTAEFRYYSMPTGSCILALLGEKWVQYYGRNIDYLHFHNYLEIGYCYEGEGTMILGEEEVPFTGEQLTVIPSNFLHTTNSAPDSLGRWEYLFVDVEGLLKKVFPNNPFRLEQALRRINSRALFLDKAQEEELVGGVLSVIDALRRNEEYSQEEAEGMMIASLLRIAKRNTHSIGDYESRIGNRSISHVIAKSLDYISNHYREPIRVKDIAQWSHISETHYRRIFQSYMNMSPLEYINLIRIQSACEYLKKTDDAVAMVAARCGFTTNSTFNRNFKRLTGVTPAQWRKLPENYERQILKFEVHSEEGW